MPAKKNPDATPALTNPIFTDADKAREHLEAMRWPSGPFCPHCGVVGESTRLEGEKHRAGALQCNACRKQFTVTVGTLFERSHIPLNKWLLAFHLMAASKKGMSAHQMHRQLDITYKTAWFMCHRIREAMKQNHTTPLGGPGKVVEADETYYGTRKGAKRYRYGPAHKNVVVSLVERGGKARSFHIRHTNKTTLRAILKKHVAPESRLMTDDAKVYKKLGTRFAEHGTVRHKWGIYVDGDKYTNTVEGFFGLLKRGIRGTFHHISEQHLGRYIAEFDFRYNHREKINADGDVEKITDAERAYAMLAGVTGKRLTYRRPDNALVG